MREMEIKVMLLKNWLSQCVFWSHPGALIASLSPSFPHPLSHPFLSSLSSSSLSLSLSLNTPQYMYTRKKVQTTFPFLLSSLISSAPTSVWLTSLSLSLCFSLLPFVGYCLLLNFFPGLRLFEVLHLLHLSLFSSFLSCREEREGKRKGMGREWLSATTSSSEPGKVPPGLFHFPSYLSVLKSSLFFSPFFLSFIRFLYVQKGKMKEEGGKSGKVRGEIFTSFWKREEGENEWQPKKWRRRKRKKKRERKKREPQKPVRSAFPVINFCLAYN